MFALVLCKSILKYPTLSLVELITAFITVFVIGLGNTEGEPTGGKGGGDGGDGGAGGNDGVEGTVAGNDGPAGVPDGG